MGNAARTFEDLHMYQRARELTNAIYALSRQRNFSADRVLVDQIRRAAVSVMSNIAEGFEHGTSAEFVQFLYVAKGSCGEVRAQLSIARDQHYIAAEEYAALHDLARRTSGMISNFIAHVQDSDYKGEKHARPQRKTVEKLQNFREQLRASQLVNMRRLAEKPPADPQEP
jgi:four helix bundle protein